MHSGGGELGRAAAGGGAAPRGSMPRHMPTGPRQLQPSSHHTCIGRCTQHCRHSTPCPAPCSARTHLRLRGVCVGHCQAPPELLAEPAGRARPGVAVGLLAASTLAARHAHEAGRALVALSGVELRHGVGSAGRRLPDDATAAAGQRRHRCRSRCVARAGLRFLRYRQCGRAQGVGPGPCSARHRGPKRWAGLGACCRRTVGLSQARWRRVALRRKPGRSAGTPRCNQGLGVCTFGGSQAAAGCVDDRNAGRSSLIAAGAKPAAVPPAVALAALEWHSCGLPLALATLSTTEHRSSNLNDIARRPGRASWHAANSPRSL